jgi:dihydroneopterin aldolase
MRWRVFVKNMETTVKIGIHDHEQKPQRILVNVEVQGVYKAPPEVISDCFNYDHVHQLAVKEWPQRAHVQLLETLAIEMLKHVFTVDNRVDTARVSIAKPDIFKEAEVVGVEASWTMDDFVKHSAAK